VSLLLVDDQDGRVVAEVESQEQALRLLACLDSADPELAESLCIVAFHEGQGGLLGVDSSLTMRTL
jgi:hypothetical protein